MVKEMPVSVKLQTIFVVDKRFFEITFHKYQAYINAKFDLLFLDKYSIFKHSICNHSILKKRCVIRGVEYKKPPDIVKTLILALGANPSGITKASI